ncbi:hypothetical protein CLAFUW4_07387 [Fulvia fulva]|nr:hypothetical protein CLAFUR4_07394 [Fulvia fulva]WPV16018.1 hypothetical protein CLAFUW4_07387 [Fulvia fulva]
MYSLILLLLSALELTAAISSHRSVCERDPYGKIVPLSKYAPALEYCSKKFPSKTVTVTVTVTKNGYKHVAIAEPGQQPAYGGPEKAFWSLKNNGCAFAQTGSSPTGPCPNGAAFANTIRASFREFGICTSAELVDPPVTREERNGIRFRDSAQQGCAETCDTSRCAAVQYDPTDNQDPITCLWFGEGSTGYTLAANPTAGVAIPLVPV